jgi:WD40 repeat protein
MSGEKKKSILQCLVGMLGWVVSVVAGASTYTSEPLLRIEAVMHTAPIAQIATDAAGRYLVTGSADQTLRLWDLATQRMLRVYRPPVAPESTSRHQAVTISPDGEQIAAGSVVPGPSASVYIFSRTTGEIIRQLSGLPSEIVSLAWSPDGRYLLLVSNKHGIRVYRTSDWALIGEDNYGSESWRGDISINNRIAVSSFDGLLRLYQIDAAGLRRVAVAPSGGARPVGVSFSPDGQRLAVGFLEAPKVLIYAATDLRKLHAASAEKAGNGSFYEVEWGRNDVLYAGGQYRQGSALGELFRSLGGGGKRATLIRRWQKGGLGAWQDIEAANDSVNSLSSLPDGGVVYATMDPAWGIINTHGTGVFVQRAYNADFYGQSTGIKISPDGLVVEFPYEAFGKSLASFNVVTRTLAAGENQSTKAATLSADGVELSTKGAFQKTFFNGRELPFEDGEFERGKAAALDGSGFVIATDFNLRFYDRDGREIWRQRTPTASRGGINISQDGRLVVASYMDGSIRWYRRGDGQALLAFWPHADKKRWVLWSPSGYYDAAPGSEEFLGWQINRFGEPRELLIRHVDPDGPAARGGMRAGDVVQSIDGTPVKTGPELRARISATPPGGKLKFLVSRNGQEHTLWVSPGNESGAPRIRVADLEVRPVLTPEFYSMGRFRERLYRPDILSKVLSTLDVVEAMRLADEESGRMAQVTDVKQILPPALTLQSLDESKNGSGAITLRFSVNTPEDAPVAEYLVRMNGKPVAISKVRNVHSEGVTVQEITFPIPPEDSEIMLFARNRNGASDPVATRLRGSGKSKPGMAAQAARPRLFVLASGVSDYVSETLRLGFAAKDAGDLASRMQDQKERLYRDVEVRSLTDRQVTRSNLINGLKWLESKVTENDVGIVFLAGHGLSDARGSYYYLASDANERNYRETGLSFIDIRNTLSKLKGRTLLMVDTCNSGDVLGRKGLDLKYVGHDLSSPENGVVVMAASTGNQVSQERKDWNNGAFTKAILEGVDGRADTRGTGKITYKMLDLYVSGRVEDLTKGKQTPFTIVPVGTTDFPVAQTR